MIGCGMVLLIVGFLAFLGGRDRGGAIVWLLLGAFVAYLGWKERPRSVSTNYTRPPNSPELLPKKQAPLHTKSKISAQKTRPRETVKLDVDINEDFQSALRLIGEQCRSAFVTGRAGTGKSTLLKYFHSGTSRETVVLAPTGLAAVNVGGQTIHSFFHFPPKLIEPDRLKVSRNTRLYKKLQMIIIDEVSMVRADLLDGIDRFLRINRGQMDEPFGGVQIVMFGDPYQLPPIVRESDLKAYFERQYGGSYFFHAPVLRDNRLPLIELKTVYRQTDPNFIGILNAVRENQLNKEVMANLNCRVIEPSALRNKSMYVTLTPTNQAAFEINMTFLESLKAPEFTFDAVITGKFDDHAHPTDETLRLRQGARVMLLRNDPSKRWVNGTLATIANLKSNKIWIEVDGARYELEPETWENIKYEYDHDSHHIVEHVAGTFRQYPIRHAWAITIHKSQGQTFDHVYIDFGAGAFAHGQAYVALSRCRSLDGLALARPLRSADVILDPDSLGFRQVFDPVA